MARPFTQHTLHTVHRKDMSGRISFASLDRTDPTPIRYFVQALKFRDWTPRFAHWISFRLDVLLRNVTGRGVLV